MKYKRLAGNRKGLGKRYSLWLGDDHLLAVESTGYSEEYTRYYLKDIQAITIRRTGRGKAWNIGLSLAFIAALIPLISGIRSGTPATTVTAAVFAVPICIILLYNIVRGPTCKCHIRMPLGVRELSQVSRVKSMEKVLKRIRPLIGRFQGSISDMEMHEMISNTPPGSSYIPAPKAPGSGRTADLADSGYNGGFHYAAFSLLLVDAAFSIVQIFSNDSAFMALSAVLNLALIACIITALVKQNGHRVSPLSGKLIWGALITMVTGGVYVYFLAFFQLFNLMKIKGAAVKSQNDIFAVFADIKPIDHPAFYIFIICYAVLSASIGAAGLLSYGKRRGIPAVAPRTVRNLPARDSDS